MSTIEVKFMIFYGMEIVVVALVGITMFAGLYQIVRSKIRSRVSGPASEAR